MPMFTKKPITIEAMELTRFAIRDVYQFVHGEMDMSGATAQRWEDYEDLVISDGMNIPTLEDGPDGRAKHVASIGDWVIKGVQGEFYPCKPDIFHATYDAA